MCERDFCVREHFREITYKKEEKRPIHTKYERRGLIDRVDQRDIWGALHYTFIETKRYVRVGRQERVEFLMYKWF